MRAEGFCKIGGECELKGCLVKLVKDELMDCLTKFFGKADAGKIEEDLVMNELMGSTEKGRSFRRITAPWCGSRVAGWRVAAGKTTVMMDVLTSLASEASFGFAGQEVECDGASNGNGDDSQKIGYQCDVYNNCFSFDGFADAVGSESIVGVRGWRGFDGTDGYDGFDGADGGFDGVDGGFDVFDGFDGFDGSGFGGFDGLDGLGDRSMKERTE